MKLSRRDIHCGIYPRRVGSHGSIFNEHVNEIIVVGVVIIDVHIFAIRASVPHRRGVRRSLHPAVVSSMPALASVLRMLVVSILVFMRIRRHLHALASE